MKTQLLMHGGNIQAQVIGGDLEFKGTDHMATVFTELSDPRLCEASLYFAGGLELKLKRSDGWVIVVKAEREKSQHVVVTRRYTGNERKINRRQYLASSMKWLPFPRGEHALPADAFRMPVFAP